jgi:hypothetical protein
LGTSALQSLSPYNSHAQVSVYLISTSERLIKYETCCNYYACNAIIDDISGVAISTSKNALVIIAVPQVVNNCLL